MRVSALYNISALVAV